MLKEFEPIQQLEARKDRLSHIIGQRESLVDRIGTGDVRVGSSFEVTLKIGEVRSEVKKSITRLHKRLDIANQELQGYEQAKNYLNELSLRQDQLAKMSELVAEGNLTEADLLLHQQQFEELVKLPETNPLLQRGIERIREEEEERKRKESEVTTKPVETVEEPKTYTLSSGEVVGGKTGELLYYVSQGSENNLIRTDQLVEKTYPGVEYGVAAKRVRALLGWGKNRLRETREDLVSVSDPASRAHGVKGGYYIRQLEQTSGFQFEKGEVAEGEVGKLITKLYPFSPHHIVSSQDLSRAVSSGETPIEPVIFAQHLQEVRRTLLHNGLRLAELPNPKDPDNVGYYIETYRPPVHITLMGDTVRYTDATNQVRQIRLTEEEWSLLWNLYGGESVLNSDLFDILRNARNLSINAFSDPSTVVNNRVDSLNRSIASLTGVEETVVSLGDENFGYWFKAKDITVARKGAYIPVYRTRQEALGLIFQDDANTTKQEIIDTLGPTIERKRASRLLSAGQAFIALAKSVTRLENRVTENIATDDEADLYLQMQDYIANHNLTDRKGLISHIADKLGLVRGTSLALDITEVSGGGVTPEADDADLFNDAVDTSIEIQEFGNLSRLDVVIIAERLEFNRERIESILGQKGLRLIEKPVMLDLIEDLMAVETMDSQSSDDHRVRAFEKLREMLKDTNFNSLSEEILDQNPNVGLLLINLSEINDVIIKQAGREEGISLLLLNPESLEEVFSENEPSSGAPTNVKPADEEVVFRAETNGQKLSPLERRDPKIRMTINEFLDQILAITELNGPVSPPLVTKHFESVKKPFIDRAVEAGWVSPILDKSHRDQVEYNAAGIATLVYLRAYGNQLPSQLKKKVQEIADEEYRKRQNGQT